MSQEVFSNFPEQQLISPCLEYVLSLCHCLQQRRQLQSGMLESQSLVESLECGVRHTVWYLSDSVLIKTGPDASPVGIPGRFGVDYAFISKPAVDIYVDQNKVSGSLFISR